MRLDKAGGKFEQVVKFKFPNGYKSQCTPIYNYMSKSQYESEIEKIDNDSTLDTDEKKTNAKLDLMMSGVKGIEDADGNPITPEKGLEMVKTWPQVYFALIAEFNELISTGNIRAKN